VARRAQQPDFDPQASRLDEEEAESRHLIPGQILQYGVAFAALFAVVFFFFWWSGAAVEFGAARVSDRAVPTWQVTGKVVNSETGEPVPWASIRDDPAGRPPFYQVNADLSGAFELLTLAEPHLVLVEARGYQPARVHVGKQWFVWWPRGKESILASLKPE
jgi:hypothetical protein